MKEVTDILIKPVITEKSNALTEKFNRFTFVVDKEANKLQIKEAVEKMYGVTVDSVKTMIMPAKSKVRYTKTGIAAGRKPAYKKAIIVLAEGEEIDFYSNI